MRRQNLATASIAVWIQTNSFKPGERQYSASKAVRLPVATADTGKLIAAATACLGIIFKPGYRYKKAGVTFLDLVAADRVQGGLFDRPDDARSIRRMRAIDQLNARFGRGAVGFGTAGERHSWGLRREFISPRYTTVWDELLRVQERAGTTMCGRFTQNYTWEELYAFRNVFGTPRNLRPHYNYVFFVARFANPLLRRSTEVDPRRPFGRRSLASRLLRGSH